MKVFLDIFTFAAKHNCFSNLNLLNDIINLANISAHSTVRRQPLVNSTGMLGTLGFISLLLAPSISNRVKASLT